MSEVLDSFISNMVQSHNEDMSGEIVVFVTTGSEEQAKQLSHVLVEQQLVACANIFPSIQSIFKWEGQVMEEKESLLMLKTRADLFKEVEAAIRAHHSYDVPEIIALPIQRGSEDYLSWVRQATKSA